MLVGVFIGWNVPQPKFAKSLQDKAINAWKNWRNADSE